MRRIVYSLLFLLIFSSISYGQIFKFRTQYSDGLINGVPTYYYVPQRAHNKPNWALNWWMNQQYYNQQLYLEELRHKHNIQQLREYYRLRLVR